MLVLQKALKFRKKCQVIKLDIGAQICFQSKQWLSIMLYGLIDIRRDPRALASGLSHVQVDKHGINILYHLLPLVNVQSSNHHAEHGLISNIFLIFRPKQTRLLDFIHRNLALH